MSSLNRALVSNIQHFCVHDGNGFRTTVFLQGCPLRCRWCQNPELQTLHSVHMYNIAACVHCGSCVDSCKKGNLNYDRNDFRPLMSSVCQECIRRKEIPCVDACVYGARELSAHIMSVDEVLTECFKERGFWGDGGGITLSGGEPLLQFDFCHEIGKRCLEQGVSLVIETCGYVLWEYVEQISKYVDIFLYDVKLVTPALRREWLGATSELDLENLHRLVNIHNHIVLRVPLIPGVNDTEHEFGSILKMAEGLGQVAGMQLLPFHQFGSSKYDLAGIDYKMAEVQTDNDAGIERCFNMALVAGFNVDLGGKAFTK